MRPQVSVLVPAFNDGDYLDTALESVVEQTFRDLEVVVADDASEDRTTEIASRWAARDSRVRVSRTARNLGMNRNWNRALGEARGELVIKLDADDAMRPECIERLVAAHRVAPGAIFAACRALDCDEALTPRGPFLGDEGFRRHGFDPAQDRVAPGEIWLRLCFDDIQLWHSDAQLYRTEDLRALSGWDERWIASDTDLIVRALATGRPVAHLGYEGILYRRRAGSSSDLARRTGLSRVETTLILLALLAREAQRLRPLGRSLRQNWWRLWHRWRADREDGSLWQSLRPEDRERLRGVLAELGSLTPPPGVRWEGWLRFQIWRLRRVAGSR